MASKGKSRWAEDDEESAEAIAQRKREKEEKRRTKEEKQRRLQEQQQQATNIATQATGDGPEQSIANANGDAAEPPAKRRRMSTDQDQGAEMEPALLRFPVAPLQSCGDVENYERLNDIEEGSYGWVSRAKDSRSGEIVALKKLKMDYTNDGFPVTGLREIQTLMASRHVHIVNLREVVTGSTLKE